MVVQGGVCTGSFGVEKGPGLTVQGVGSSGFLDFGCFRDLTYRVSEVQAI